MGTEKSKQGEVLKRLRERAGLTQAEAAEELGLNERTYGSYERGERNISYNQMQEAKHVLGGGTHAAEDNCATPDHEAVKQYPVAEAVGEDVPDTIYVDTRILTVDQKMPGPEDATAHLVSGRRMGMWMRSEQYVIAQDCDEIQTAGRYVVRWAESETKTIIEAERQGNQAVLVRMYAPRRERTLSRRKTEGSTTLYQGEDGSDVTIETLGKVILPSDKGRQLMHLVTDQLNRVARNPTEKDGVL